MRYSNYLSVTVSVAALMAASSALAQQNASAIEEIVVTGSRVVTNSTKSPTPLTVVSTEQLKAVATTNIPDALNKLPVFQGSSTQRTFNNPSGNASGNVVSLRNFGAQRTLVLFDGHRVTPSTAAGTADIDVLPQMLLQRVDVVTGGASAVYGSDAVTGVVNFILDKNFNGLKFDTNAGIAQSGVGLNYQVGVAAGATLLGGRAHIEGSYRYFESNEVPRVDVYAGSDVYLNPGAGTVANPITLIRDGRNAATTWGGRITCASCGTLNGMNFAPNGLPAPFVNGVLTGTNNTQSGGDGSWSRYTSGLAELQSKEIFARLSYDITNDITAYTNVSATTSINYNYHYTKELRAGGNKYFWSNAFLPASVGAGLAPGSTFTLGKQFDNLGRDLQQQTFSATNFYQVNSGVTGKFGEWNWDLFYTHGESKLRVTARNNVDNAKLNAANDAVVNPANGQIVCQVSLTSFANLYPGCVPMNPFGYGATTRAMAQYIDVDTWNDQINTMDDAGGSIAGSLFNLPAGPVRVALSGEWRNLGYTVHSDFRPTDVVDCTGLRLCTANIPRYWLNTVAPVNTSEHVWEAAIEANVPLLKDMPLVEELTLNLADRITDYSVSGQVSTWKVGADYHINSQIRIRGTASVDIRAPTLTDLFQPITRSSTGYTDIHTGVGLSTQTQSQGNPKLVPEVARTYTAGVVLTPQALSNFNIALDYYQITLNNSIGTLNAGNTQVQQLCEAANGSGPICALYQRPLPFSDRTAANYPTLILSQGLNASYQAIRGWDLEANYRFDMAKFFSKTPGSVSLRLLGNYQPYNTTIQFLGATPTYVAAPKTRITGTAAYTVGEWRFNAVDRWYSSYNQATSDGQIYANPTVPAFMVVDLGVSREFKAWNRGVTAYFQVDNVFDPKPPITGGGSANPGFASAINAIYPVLGRTFTVGVRGKF